MTRAAGKPMREIIGGGKKASLALKTALDHLPLSRADAIANGKPDPAYQNWFAQSRRDDPFWRVSDLSARVPQVTAAVHLIAGWHDIFLREQLADYAALVGAGRAPFLTIGPWHHTSPDLAFQSVREALAWFDAHLRRRGSLRDQPVCVAVLGGSATKWREFPRWPPPAHTARYWLHLHGRLLREAPDASPESSVDQYRYDPSDPTPSVGGPGLAPESVGVRDNRSLEARIDVLCYTSPAFETELEIIGSARLSLYARSSLEHTDFFGRVCDVYPDGRSLNVCDGLVRIEPGKGQPQPDGSLCIEIEMGPIAYHFQTGHCLRLQVSSGAHPRWSRNLGTGEPMSTATQMVVADQTIYHDHEHPSVLVLPVVPSEKV
jgi:putative CocE/NonD family hydrolase